jgi:hypothetical protein
MKPTYKELSEAVQLLACSYLRLLQDLYDDYEIDSAVTLLNLGVSLQQDVASTDKPSISDITTLLKLVLNKSSDATTSEVM